MPTLADLSEWIEKEIRLPKGTSALPGPVRLWSFQKEIADAISDPLVERVSVVKCVRVGYTSLVVAAIGSFVANEPCPVLALLPTEADARDFAVSDLEPTFGASPILRGSLSFDTGEGIDRNTLLSRRSSDGWIAPMAKVLPVKAARSGAGIGADHGGADRDADHASRISGASTRKGHPGCAWAFQQRGDRCWIIRCDRIERLQPAFRQRQRPAEYGWTHIVPEPSRQTVHYTA
jgi:hypothetical protein